ncbi:MAG: hypothetical protein IPQ07_04960 [Myxococcales bacterium]|nr:hypothetical protein [Myxococcales bacterium]
MSSLFADIMRRAVEATPGAVGGAFADSEGEMVDSFSTLDKHDWAVLTAHYGVVLSHLHSCFGTWHYGGPEYFIAQHAKLDVVVHTIAHGYFALLAVEEYQGAGPLAVALTSIRAAANELRKEIA